MPAGKRRSIIVTSDMENIAGIASVLSVICTKLCDCAELDFAGTTTDVTLEQQIQTGHPRKFP